MAMKMQESSENYLETILVLGSEHTEVRSIDIVNHMGFSKPSVSIAMRKLRENGYIEMDDNGFITLTDDGREIAEKVFERHEILRKYLTSLGVPPEIAAEDACRMEHVISNETFAIFKQHAINEHHVEI